MGCFNKLKFIFKKFKEDRIFVDHTASLIKVKRQTSSRYIFAPTDSHKSRIRIFKLAGHPRGTLTKEYHIIIYF